MRPNASSVLVYSSLIIGGALALLGFVTGIYTRAKLFDGFLFEGPSLFYSVGFALSVIGLILATFFPLGRRPQPPRYGAPSVADADVTKHVKLLSKLEEMRKTNSISETVFKKLHEDNVDRLKTALERSV